MITTYKFTVVILSFEYGEFLAEDVNDGKRVLEGHVGQDKEEGSVDVHNPLLRLVILAQVDDTQNDSNELTIKKVRSEKWKISPLIILRLTTVWNILTWMSMGSLTTDKKLLHWTATNCSHQLALYGDRFVPSLPPPTNKPGNSRSWVFSYSTSAKTFCPEQGLKSYKN